MVFKLILEKELSIFIYRADNRALWSLFKTYYLYLFMLTLLRRLSS